MTLSKRACAFLVFIMARLRTSAPQFANPSVKDMYRTVVNLRGPCLGTSDAFNQLMREVSDIYTTATGRMRAWWQRILVASLSYSTLCGGLDFP